MRVKATAAFLGGVFGFMLCWSTLATPDAIRRMLLFEDWYLYAMFPLAVGTGFVGVRLLRRGGVRALFSGTPVSWSISRPERRHVVGSVLFGLGWAITDGCPGPIAAQLGRGLAWSLCTTAGVAVGIVLYLRRAESLTIRAVADPLRLPLRRRPQPAAEAAPEPST
jgi:uncharacterized membrane protein YedE/YeeE